jgi:hypothetical protein
MAEFVHGSIMHDAVYLEHPMVGLGALTSVCLHKRCLGARALNESCILSKLNGHNGMTYDASDIVIKSPMSLDIYHQDGFEHCRV